MFFDQPRPPDKFQLAYDVHKCRMIPRLVIILEGEMCTSDKMAKENVPSPAPTRFDEQILPFKAWLPIGKANVPTIYIQQFWNTFTQEAKSRVYSFQRDEQWFTLNVDLLRKALKITHVDSAHPFVSPLASEHVMDFMNNLGYPEEIHFVSKMHGIVTRTNVDYAKLLWEEFVQAIHIFFAHQDNLNIPTKKPGSPVHVTSDDFPLGNLKFVPKAEKDEVFGKPIPNELITEAIRNSSYYQQYLEMVARKPIAKEGGQKKTSSKADKPTPIKKPAPTKQTKPVKEKSTKPAPSKKARKGKELKYQKGKSSLQLVDEEDEETQPVPEPQLEDDEQTPVTEEAFTGPFAKPQDDTSANVVRDTPSPTDAKTGADTEKSNSEGDTKILDVDKERVYPQIHENLKHTNEERVLIEKPLSSYETLSSIKNLDDAFTYGDQFLNDKPIKKEADKANVEAKVESMVMVLIHQASSSTPPLSIPIIVISSFKPVSPSIQEPVFIVELQQQQQPFHFHHLHYSKDKTVQALSSRVFMLENHDMYSKINKHVNEESLHDRMFKSGSYKSHLDQKALYEALEVSMDRDNKEEFLDATEKSWKRRRDDQDPPPKGSHQSKKTRHDSDTSASQEPPTQTSSAWKTFDIRDAPFSSFKQNISHLFE
nr:E-beta-farnesene synthase [Tanacetum cinerariifolium]